MMISQHTASHKSRLTLTRSATPSDALYSSAPKQFNYTNFKQKLRTIIKPSDYSMSNSRIATTRIALSNLEISDSASHLKILKNKLNTLSQRTNIIHKSLSSLKSQRIQVDMLRSIENQGIFALKNQVSLLEYKENELNCKLNEEIYIRSMLKYMYSRTRLNLLPLETQKQYFLEQLRLKDLIVKAEQKTVQKTMVKKTLKLQSLRDLKQSITINIKSNTNILASLQKEKDFSAKLANIYKTRVKRYGEIVESTVNEALERKSNKIIENIRVHIFWANFMDFTLRTEKKQNLNLENAFKSIIGATLVKSPFEIAKRFLNREAKLRKLNGLIENKKNICLETAKNNEKTEEKINVLLLTNNYGKDSYIQQLSNTIVNVKKQITSQKERRQMLFRIIGRVDQWVVRRLDTKLFISSNTLKEKFEIMHKQISASIKSLKRTPFITDLDY